MDHCPVCGKVLANSTTSRTCTCGYSEWFGPHMLNQEPATMSNQEPDGWVHGEWKTELQKVRELTLYADQSVPPCDEVPVMLIDPQELSRLRAVSALVVRALDEFGSTRLKDEEDLNEILLELYREYQAITAPEDKEGKV